ncbi:site-specific integrase [Chelatococcus asaccharovorans]|uniref:tyrosine-type recombinase/integrase n=1 Tax=Chelatococcus asaccharovorans TaxID=28210 RepID=UPI003159E172
MTEPKAFGALLRAIDGYEGEATTTAALKLLALLFPRPGELRAAHWSAFKLDEGLWTVLEARMKMRRPHRVPLSKQAVAILKDVQQLTGPGTLVFPSIRSVLRPMSENTLNAALRRLGFTKDEMTSHGFRARASSMLNESRFWHPVAIERQPAHVEENSVRRA